MNFNSPHKCNFIFFGLALLKSNSSYLISSAVTKRNIFSCVCTCSVDPILQKSNANQQKWGTNINFKHFGRIFFRILRVDQGCSGGYKWVYAEYLLDF